MIRHLWIPILLLAACSGESGPAIIANPNLLVADVTLDTFASFPGTFIHGPATGGPGGGGVCGTIEEVNGYRTDTDVVFRIEETDDFCFDTDVYEIIIQNITWKGVAGTVLFVNNGDPLTQPTGVAFFIPDNGPLDLIEEINVSQWRNQASDNFLYLSVPLRFFRFTNADDPNSVFDVVAQIERPSTLTNLSWTDSVNVDFVDLP